jgi:transposase-like protein
MLRLSGEKIDIRHWELLSKSLRGGNVRTAFLTEKDCEEAVFQSIWELGFECPNCQFEGKFWNLKTRSMYQCSECGHQFSARSRTPLRRKRIPFLDCFKGAEWIIITMAAENSAVMTIDRFSTIMDLSYRSARILRLELFEELKKPLGGFWGRLICTDEVDESLYIGDRLDKLLEYYNFDDLKEPFTKLGN